MRTATQFINCRQCINGQLVATPLTIDEDGLIIPSTPLPPSTTTIDLQNQIIAPGFIEIQINGALGFHFANYVDSVSYTEGIQKLSHYLPSTGVTGFYPTVPTVSTDVFHSVLPFLKPAQSPKGASVLGAHVEGPFLAPSKKGAHNAENMHVPEKSSLEDVYGEHNLKNVIEIVTMAPELPGALGHIEKLSNEYGICARYLLRNRPTFLASLTLFTPYPLTNPPLSLHPSIISLLYHTRPNHALLTTDSIELSGLPDGTYPGHAQIPHPQQKTGNKVTIAGTDTLIGTCIPLDQCVRNLMDWAKVPVEKAVMTVTENVADALALEDRGRFGVGMRGDFVVLGEEAEVRETWLLGRKVWGKGGEASG
ncbi:n-acetylglucosamine-6-phosphate deacetylase protein [Rutstroemia sp. NJR-2017a BBW]|nr:n-acetylglucosamine-6-phosphate deacetylase protein [Rutstroemia sp. NJR-2017a BBW]